MFIQVNKAYCFLNNQADLLYPARCCSTAGFLTMLKSHHAKKNVVASKSMNGAGVYKGRVELGFCSLVLHWFFWFHFFLIKNHQWSVQQRTSSMRQMRLKRFLQLVFRNLVCGVVYCDLTPWLCFFLSKLINTNGKVSCCLRCRTCLSTCTCAGETNLFLHAIWTRVLFSSFWSPLYLGEKKNLPNWISTLDSIVHLGKKRTAESGHPGMQFQSSGVS